MKRLLAQLQLSNYDTHGKFILEADSGYQMVANRADIMLGLNPADLEVTMVGPKLNTLVTYPWDINPRLWNYHGNRIKYVELDIVPNALATRYNFDIDATAKAIDIPNVEYDAIYINDPMLLRHYKAMFHLKAKKKPKFFVHSHFIDNPECPKFPVDASLWLGQCEAALRADFNFWQCEASLKIFLESMARLYRGEVVKAVEEKSLPWDDGYSQREITSPVNTENIRFDTHTFMKEIEHKIVIFVPNRIGGMGRSSDYTNCGKFMFELLPQLRQRREDFIVIAGNPSQKILNGELVQLCGENGYINLVPDALTRDEFKFIARNSHIAVGLYTNDTYGGTVARECIELGCLPMWVDNYEYASLARDAGGYPFLAKTDWSDFVNVLSSLIDYCTVPGGSPWLSELQTVVRERCSYECTTPEAMKRMGLL